MNKVKKFIQSKSYYLCFITPIIALIGLTLNGLYVWLTPVFIFLILPIFDNIFPLDIYLCSTKEKLGNFSLVTLYLSIIFLFYYAASVEITNVFNYLGVITTLGILTGGVTGMIAHEFMHKKTKIYKVISQILLLYCFYPHFYVVHLFIHHPFVGTDKDPSTARKDENIYSFLLRSVFGSLRRWWQFENQQNALKEKKFPRRICYAIGLISVALSVWLVGGYIGLVIYLGQSAIAIFELEAVNYIEHYGLSRFFTNGKLQNLDVKHSWNSRHYLSSRILLNIPRHSAHHLHPTRSFEKLQHYHTSLQYPLGYPGMILLSLIPGLWKKVVHPLLSELNYPTGDKV